MQYNIAKKDGSTMLSMWVSSAGEALKWYLYYISEYTPGKPYPNGKGHYPDFGFHIIWRE